MVLQGRGQNTLPLEDIAQRLGFCVPVDMQEKFPFAKTSENSQDWGVHPFTYETSVEKLLSEVAPELRFRFIHINNILAEEVGETIAELLQRGSDIIVGYDYKEAFGEGAHVGHVSIINTINTITDEVGLVDSESPHKVQISLKSLQAGIRKKKDGLWVIYDSSQS